MTIPQNCMPRAHEAFLSVENAQEDGVDIDSGQIALVKI